jgi:hypothetical protein
MLDFSGILAAILGLFENLFGSILGPLLEMFGTIFPSS